MANGEGLADLLLGQPEVSERIMRALALKGALPQYLAPEFQPQVIAEDLNKPEFSWLRRETLWGAGLFAPAVVGETSLVTLGGRTNAQRAVIGTVEYVIITNQNAAVTSFRYGLIDQAHQGSAASTSDGSPRDDRQAAQTKSFFGVGIGSNAGVITTFTNSQFVLLPASTSLYIPGPFILTLGNSAAPAQCTFAVWGTALNQSVQASFQWRERAMLVTEQT